MYSVDLHTHSTDSHDGGIKAEEYAHLIENEILDYIAITDHNKINLAKKLHASLGDHIIIGEEIMTTEGEIIGLFLKEKIPPYNSLEKTIRMIQEQSGIVYVPHPFETVRKGLPINVMQNSANNLDIIEVHNGRALFQNRGPKAATWARIHNKAVAASSDAHGKKGVGTTYTKIAEKPTPDNLASSLKKAHFVINRPPIHTLLYPKINQIRKRLRKT